MSVGFSLFILSLYQSVDESAATLRLPTGSFRLKAIERYRFFPNMTKSTAALNVASGKPPAA